VEGASVLAAVPLTAYAAAGGGGGYLSVAVRTPCGAGGERARRGERGARPKGFKGRKGWNGGMGPIRLCTVRPPPTQRRGLRWHPRAGQRVGAVARSVDGGAGQTCNAMWNKWIRSRPTVPRSVLPRRHGAGNPMMAKYTSDRESSKEPGPPDSPQSPRASRPTRRADTRRLP